MAEGFVRHKQPWTGDELAKVITLEMGKIFSEAEAEVEKCAHEADWYAEHGPKILADEPAATIWAMQCCAGLISASELARLWG